MKECSKCPSYRLQLPHPLFGNRQYYYCFELGRKSEVPEKGCRSDCPLSKGLRSYVNRRKGGKK